MKRLSRLVTGRYTNFDWAEYEKEMEPEVLSFIQEGDLPDAAMERATAIIANSAGKSRTYSILDDQTFDHNLG
jgi:hypothetical protein